MPHAGVCCGRRLPRLPRYAGQSGTLTAGHVFSPSFLPCSKKVGRLPGRDPASCRQQNSQTQQTSKANTSACLVANLTLPPIHYNPKKATGANAPSGLIVRRAVRSLNTAADSPSRQMQPQTQTQESSAPRPRRCCPPRPSARRSCAGWSPRRRWRR